jgi:hypothetical protein
MKTPPCFLSQWRRCRTGAFYVAGALTAACAHSRRRRHPQIRGHSPDLYYLFPSSSPPPCSHTHFTSSSHPAQTNPSNQLSTPWRPSSPPAPSARPLARCVPWCGGSGRCGAARAAPRGGGARRDTNLIERGERVAVLAGGERLRLPCPGVLSPARRRRATPFFPSALRAICVHQRTPTAASRRGPGRRTRPGGPSEKDTKSVLLAQPPRSLAAAVRSLCPTSRTAAATPSLADGGSWTLGRTPARWERAGSGAEGRHTRAPTLPLCALGHAPHPPRLWIARRARASSKPLLLTPSSRPLPPHPLPMFTDQVAAKAAVEFYGPDRAQFRTFFAFFMRERRKRERARARQTHAPRARPHPPSLSLSLTSHPLSSILPTSCKHTPSHHHSGPVHRPALLPEGRVPR